MADRDDESLRSYLGRVLVVAVLFGLFLVFVTSPLGASLARAFADWYLHLVAAPAR